MTPHEWDKAYASLNNRQRKAFRCVSLGGRRYHWDDMKARGMRRRELRVFLRLGFLVDEGRGWYRSSKVVHPS